MSPIVHLSDKDVRRLRQYVSYLLEAMRLSEYTVLINEDATETDGYPEAWASVIPTEGRAVVTLTVSVQWATSAMDDGIRTHVLIHEMAHLFHRHTWDHLEEVLWNGGYLPASHAATVKGIIRDDHEKMVDKIADMLETMLKPFPLPKDSPINPRVRLNGNGA